MPIQDSLTGQIIGSCFKVTCPLVNFGRAKIQVRRLCMDRVAETGDVDLKVDQAH